jgi:hypothetical protein
VQVRVQATASERDPTGAEAALEEDEVPPAGPAHGHVEPEPSVTGRAGGASAEGEVGDGEARDGEVRDGEGGAAGGPVLAVRAVLLAASAGGAWPP